MHTKNWPAIKDSKALLIGHDPRLQNSDTIAEYAMFADYYFKPAPENQASKQKYGLAASAFNLITHLTNGRIRPEQVYITNLCNKALPASPKNRTVLIPEEKAVEGLQNIRLILANHPTIKYVFPMSLQVNYWLQKLGFYTPNKSFIEDSEPKAAGLMSTPPYYHPKKQRTFLMICGNQYKVIVSDQIVIPVLHVKNFPLKRNFMAYSECYDRVQSFFEAE